MTNDDLATIDDLTIRFERRLPAPVARVWRAVTDPDEMRAWFPSAVVGQRRVGAPLSFPFDSNVADTFGGEVTEWEPERVFAFTWNGDRLRIELTADGDGATVLVFTHELSHRTEAARTASGWQACLGNLVAHLGGPAPDPDTWKTMYATYLRRMGPPLGVAGDDGSMTWERVHHVSPDDLDAAFADPSAWGAAESFADVAVRRTATEHGTHFTVTHRTAGGDPELAAHWHALLTQLDMYLAAKQLVPADPALFVDAYRAR